MAKSKVDIPFKYKVKNKDARWYRIWKRRVSKEFVLDNVELDINEESVSSGGTVVYKVELDAKALETRIKKFIEGVTND